MLGLLMIYRDHSKDYWLRERLYEAGIKPPFEWSKGFVAHDEEYSMDQELE
jgi:hypothetical protein